MTLLLIDASIYLHKAFDGINTINPVKRFFDNFKFLLSVVGKPVDKVIWCLDGDCRTFRHKKYLPYKAQRPEKTQEFRDFKSYIEGELKKKFIVALHPEYEADDIVSTLARYYTKDVFIASADLDQSQLVSDRVHMLKVYDSNSYEHVDINYVVNRYGIYPYQIADYKALSGDKSDNIKLPIKGVGGIKAATMLMLYDNIDNIYLEIENNPKEFIYPRIMSDLLAVKNKVYLFRELTTLDKDVPGVLKLI